MLDVKATEVTDQMLVVAARAIAETVLPEQLNTNFIIPGVFHPTAAKDVARAIRQEFKNPTVA